MIPKLTKCTYKLFVWLLRANQSTNVLYRKTILSIGNIHISLELSRVSTFAKVATVNALQTMKSIATKYIAAKFERVLLYLQVNRASRDDSKKTSPNMAL